MCPIQSLSGVYDDRLQGQTALSDLYKLLSVNYRFNIVKFAAEHGPFDSGVSIMQQCPVSSESLPREVLEVSFLPHR